jgi:hypothetical protein
MMPQAGTNTDFPQDFACAMQLSANGGSANLRRMCLAKGTQKQADFGFAVHVFRKCP